MLTDLSVYPESYNKFLITEGLDFTLGIVGDYKYFVYQMPDETDTDFTNNGYLVEQGKMRLLKEMDADAKQYTSENNVEIFN